MTQDSLVQEEGARSRHSQPAPHKKTNGYLEKPYATYSTYQKMQIQKARLRFLQNCRYRKRPPPSLRICGASSLDIKEKVAFFSNLESDLLSKAITNKQDLLKYLSSEVKDNNLPTTPLPEKDCKAIRDHFAKKQAFYKKQDQTKWKDWPEKSLRKQLPADKKGSTLRKGQREIEGKYKKQLNV